MRRVAPGRAWNLQLAESQVRPLSQLPVLMLSGTWETYNGRGNHLSPAHNTPTLTHTQTPLHNIIAVILASENLAKEDNRVVHCFTLTLEVCMSVSPCIVYMLIEGSVYCCMY